MEKLIVLQRSEEMITDYFHQFIFGFIYHDIERCIEARANYLVALALLSYTEYLGGLASGNLGLVGKSQKNFEKALDFFPQEYKQIDSSILIQDVDEDGKQILDNKGKPKQKTGIYHLFRCGMVHEYFIRGFATVYNDPSGLAKNHIGIVKAERLIEWPKEYKIPPYTNKVLEFHTNEYFRDFKLAVDKIFKMLIIDKNQG
ncbi:MAG: hypothetical protein HY667_04880, partial [Chloroflexi bacterium]|nr:hypothetical protein [Chloroflexota bacterium]